MGFVVSCVHGVSVCLGVSRCVSCVCVQFKVRSALRLLPAESCHVLVLEIPHAIDVVVLQSDIEVNKKKDTDFSLLNSF